jgi:N-carbamoyl-L-amino-acid hydrolase
VIALEELNALPTEGFVEALGGVFERSAWVAERVAGQRPFASQLHLHEAMCQAVIRAEPAEQLALIRAHPELAGRAASRGEITAESTREQKGAGLADCTVEELGRLRALNAQYSQRFGFPFVVAVKGLTRSSILAALEQRISHSLEHERNIALEQIGRIAGFRLAELVAEPTGARIVSMADFLGRLSEQTDGLTCSYLTPTHRATAALIRDWMLAAGLEVTIDAVGNVIGWWRSTGSTGRALLTGSHYDTVINGGRYDGRLGILLPIAVIAALRRQAVVLPYPLAVIAFAEEEGVRFKSTFLGSSAIAGQFDSRVLDVADASGVTVRQAMMEVGLDPSGISAAALDPAAVLGYVEVHIEQGPVLLNENLPVGVVTSIAGSIRSRVSVVGVAGHSGTVPMHLRHDAATAAADLVLAVERRCSGTPGLVGTVGQLGVPGGAMNVIPGRCELSVDIRADKDEVRDAAHADLRAESEGIATRRGVRIEWQEILDIDACPCADRMQRELGSSVRRVTGFDTARYLPSGAGHDAMVMASLTEVGMLFVRCGNGGISHHPAESLAPADAEVAARVLADFLTRWSPIPHD